MFKEQIHDYIQWHKTEIVDTLKELIRIPSVKGEAEENAPFGAECARVLEFTKNLYEDNGFDTALEPTAEDRATSIEKMTLYIQNNYHKHISINDLAALIECGRTTVNNLFRKDLGTSPAQYILRFRVYMAEEFLKNSPEIPIKEVARLCGFKSTSYLDRRFKLGTPRNFKKQYMKKTEQ